MIITFYYRTTQLTDGVHTKSSSRFQAVRVDVYSTECNFLNHPKWREEGPTGIMDKPFPTMIKSLRINMETPKSIHSFCYPLNFSFSLSSLFTLHPSIPLFFLGQDYSFHSSRLRFIEVSRHPIS